jgi:hypothetical protein
MKMNDSSKMETYDNRLPSEQQDSDAPAHEMVAGTGRTGVLSCPTRRGKRWRRGPEGFDPLVLELLETVVPSRERNAFIVAATEEALRREQLRKVTRALREKPAWSDEDHPDLMTLKDVDRYVRRLRETWMPRS